MNPPTTFSFQDNNNMTNGFYSTPALSLPPPPPTPVTNAAFLDLNFASEVNINNNNTNNNAPDIYHSMLQNQAMKYQAAQQQQMMYSQRRDSVSSTSGTTKRMQTKAEKRAEHNAIERARRENLNSRFQQLAHLLPNLQHDTRPSKGTIIDRTLEFVKNALQKEERYRNEIKDLRHTNRQLLKHLHYLTTGEKDTMDSDDQLSDKSISSPPLTANSDIISVEPPSHPSQNNNNNNNNSNNDHDNDMICTTPISSPSPSLITSPITKDQSHSPSIKHTTTNPTSSNATTTSSPSHHSMMPLNHSVQTYQQHPSLLHDQKLLPNQLIQQQQESYASSLQIKPLTTFSSEVWHQPTTTYWPPHTTPTATPTTFNQVSSSLPYQDSTLPPHSSMGFMNPNLVSTDMKSVHCQDQLKLINPNVKLEYLNDQSLAFQPNPSQLGTRITSRPTSMDSFSHLSFK